MSGIEYASIQPGDLSPGVMNVDPASDATTNESAAASTNTTTEEENKQAPAADRRSQLMR
jgi:hypothetical protein